MTSVTFDTVVSLVFFFLAQSIFYYTSHHLKKLNQNFQYLDDLAFFVTLNKKDIVQEY